MLFKPKKRVQNYLVHLINPIKFNKNLKYFSFSSPRIVWSTFISRSPSCEDKQLGTMITSNIYIYVYMYICIYVYIYICTASRKPFLYRKRPPQQNGDRRKRYSSSAQEWGHGGVAWGNCVSQATQAEWCYQGTPPPFIVHLHGQKSVIFRKSG